MAQLPFPEFLNSVHSIHHSPFPIHHRLHLHSSPSSSIHGGHAPPFIWTQQSESAAGEGGKWRTRPEPSTPRNSSLNVRRRRRFFYEPRSRSREEKCENRKTHRMSGLSLKNGFRIWYTTYCMLRLRRLLLHQSSSSSSLLLASEEEEEREEIAAAVGFVL